MSSAMQYIICLVQFLSALLLSRALLVLADTTASAGAPQSTACGDIVNNSTEYNVYIFNASLVYECLTSVPFNAAVATRFIKYYNDTLQFQSTLAYLKDPPSSYQQPAVDLHQGLSDLQQAVDDGKFPNQYEFEAAVQALILASHDDHLYLDAGILSAFTFASPYDLVSLSIDGVQEPKVYLADDLFNSTYFTTFQPSAVQTINGQDVTAYLEAFAKTNSAGMLEPNADWNQLFLSAAGEILGYWDVFSGYATFYPGDTVTFTFENGSTLTDDFLGIYLSPGPTGPLETGGDFYNFFVLGFYPASFNLYEDDNNATSTSASVFSTVASSTSASVVSSTSAAVSVTATIAGWDSDAYPSIPDVAQENLGLYGGGFVSGYFLNSTSVAVLSIPSFDEYGDALNTFQDTIDEFLNKSKAAGLQKVVIDLQQNAGGQVLLAFETFRRFFPNIDPFGGSRMRAHASANTMGETITDFFARLNISSVDYAILAADEWVATDRINANTNSNFSNWAEFYGPNEYHGDSFTTTQRYNLSSEVFDKSAVDNEVDLEVYSPETGRDSPPYAAGDIILLTDGTCSSSCAVFLEMMHHEAGVRVVAAGGRPVTGPMQGASGSRGARLYDIDTLDGNIGFAQSLLEASSDPAAAKFLPNRTAATSVFQVAAAVNLRDQVRRNQTTPLQFLYDAADCRIWYTPRTIWNYTALWQYAADAIWTDTSKCVANSTGYTTGPDATTAASSPPVQTAASFQLADLVATISNISAAEVPYDLGSDLEDLSTRNNQSTRSCTTDTDCGAHMVCQTVQACINKPASKICVGTCPRIGGACNGGGVGGTCRRLPPGASALASGQKFGSTMLQRGFCNITSSLCNAAGNLAAVVIP